jgi:hypothetical protein
MTANELADKLGMVRIGLTLEAATMLRQQAQEIEAFKLRELTDEEIYRLWQKHLDDDVPTFARALLKEAGEK